MSTRPAEITSAYDWRELRDDVHHSARDWTQLLRDVNRIRHSVALLHARITRDTDRSSTATTDATEKTLAEKGPGPVNNDDTRRREQHDLEEQRRQQDDLYSDGVLDGDDIREPGDDGTPQPDLEP